MFGKQLLSKGIQNVYYFIHYDFYSIFYNKNYFKSNHLKKIDKKNKKNK